MSLIECIALGMARREPDGRIVTIPRETCQCCEKPFGKDRPPSLGDWWICIFCRRDLAKMKEADNASVTTIPRRGESE